MAANAEAQGAEGDIWAYEGLRMSRVVEMS